MRVSPTKFIEGTSHIAIKSTHMDLPTTCLVCNSLVQLTIHTFLKLPFGISQVLRMEVRENGNAFLDETLEEAI